MIRYNRVAEETHETEVAPDTQRSNRKIKALRTKVDQLTDRIDLLEFKLQQITERYTP